MAYHPKADPIQDVITQEFDIGGAGGFRGNLDPEYLIRLQINRCAVAQTTGDEVMYAGAVRALINQLPMEKRKKIESMKEEYTSIVEDYEYVKIGGWKVGTPEKPVYANLPDDEDYDPNLRQIKIVKETKTEKIKRLNEETGKEEEVEREYEVEREEETFGEPLLISPKKILKEVVDYEKLNVIAMEELQDSGLTWKMDKIEIFTGELWEPPEKDDEEKLGPVTETDG